MSNLNLRRTVAAGLAGTAAMTMVMLAAPFMGLPPMNIGRMLGSVMGGSVALGWAAHFMLGTGLAGAYAALARRLPGSTLVRGMIFATAPWLMAQLIVMPMMGAGLFSGSALVAGASLMGHLVYGAVVALVYDKNVACGACATPHRRAPA